MSRLDLLLVTPPTHVGVYQQLSHFAAIEPPVWSGLLARHCLDLGFSVEILDAEAEGLTDDQTARRIASANPVLVAFSIYGHHPSASTQCMPGALAVSELLEHRAPHIPKLAFGTHPSALPEKTMGEGFDYVCRGEGVYTLPSLIDALKNGRDLSFSSFGIPGLTWSPDRKNWLRAKSTPSAPLVGNLDFELPGQAWELLHMERYRPLFWHAWTGSSTGYASVQTSLGCPFKCSFCCINAPFGSAQIRHWGAKNVADQISRLVDVYGITNIKIPDEMFFLNKQHVRDLCKELVCRGLGGVLNMWAYARIDTVKDEELLFLAREAGFKWLGIGIESASKHVRDGVEKGRFDNEAILRACERVESFDLHIGANYIFGLPDDTQESMKETLALAYEVNAAHANFYCAMAYPGSPLHKLAEEKGWELPEGMRGPGWIGYSQHARESLPLRTEALSYTDVLDFRDDAFMLYHTRQEYLTKLLDKFGPKAVDNMSQITALGRPFRRHREPPYSYEDECPF